MPLILRAVKGSKLTISEMDGNLTYLSSTLSGSVIQVTGSSIDASNTSITASSFIGSGSGITGIVSSSYASTSSYSTTLLANVTHTEIGQIRFRNSANTTIAAINDLTASLAATASSVTPLNQNVLITGSLTISSSNGLTNIGTARFSGNNTISGSLIVSGSSTFNNTLFVVTGSQFYTGSSVYHGNQTITGSLNLTSNGIGTGLYINGQKQFNYLSAYHTASITVTQNVSGSFIYSTVITSSGITITNGSRITFANTGIYNIQFSVQLYTPTNNTDVHIWFKRNGTNIANSATRVDYGSANYGVAAWNFVDTFTSGSYVEIAYQSDESTTEFQYASASGNIPAIPSIIVSVTQVA